MLLLASSAWGQCTDGCLRCNKIDENSSDCLICDAPGFYVPFGKGLCIKLEVEGCEVPTVDRSINKCVKCKTGFIFDTVTNTCKEVADKIANCKDYDSSADCQFCEDGYYLNGAECTAVPTDNVKANCSRYNSDATACLDCGSGFYLNAKTGECDTLTKVDNCIGYTQNQCLACASGYITNKNHKLSLTMNESFYQSIVMASVLGSGDNTFLYSANVDNCEKTTVLNCAQFETFDKCSVCDAGYFLNEEGKKCTLLPQEPIKNCKVYTNATTCATCVNGAYKLIDECRASTVVEHCHEYSQTADACLECKYGYFLDGSTCSVRTITESSNQCKTFELDEDKCAVCNPNFVLNNDRDECLAIVPYCASSAVSSSDVVSCNACESGYGLSGGLCVVRDVDNCMTYDGNNAACGECEDNFYLHDAGMKCSANTVKNCSVKSKVANECVTCNNLFYLNSSASNTCSMQDVANCITFTDNQNVCEACLEGFFIESAGASCGRYTLRNCTTPTADANTCDVCESGYYPDAAYQYKCAPQDRLNCTGYVTNENTCDTCPTDFWLDDDGSGNLICKPKNKSNCTTYEVTFANDNCATCETGHYLDGGDCSPQNVAECAEYKPNLNECQTCNSLFFGVTCATIAKTGCQESNGTDNVCTECAAGYVLSGGSCTLRATSPTAPATTVPKVDPTCTGNTSSADDGTCTECANNHYRFHVGIFSWSTATVSGVSMANCAEWDTSADTCLMCKNNFGTDASQDTCSTAAIGADICTQKISGSAGSPLAENKDCESCIANHYIKDDGADLKKCHPRTFLSLNCLTGYENPGEDQCTYCKAGSNFSTTTNFAVCLSAPSPDKPECLSVDTETVTNCTACMFGGDNVGACDSDGSVKSIKNTFTIASNNLVLGEFLDGNSTFAASCATESGASLEMMGVNSLGEAMCSVCPATGDTISVLGHYSGSQKFGGNTFIANTPLNTKKYTIDSVDYNIVPWANLPGLVDDCKAKADIESSLPRNKIVTTADTNPSDSIDDAVYGGDDIAFGASGANIGYAIGVNGFMYTVACKKGFYPKTYTTTAQWTPTDASSQAEISTPNDIQTLLLTECQAYGGSKPAIKRFEGLGYKTGSAIPLPAYIQFDSCIQDTDLFFYVGEIKASFADLAGENTLFHVALTQSSYDQHCIPKTALDGDLHTIVPNCQVHLNASDDVDTLKGAQATFECLSCKPGYAPTFDGANGIGITACTLIENCDISNDATNTWMNMCQTCSAGHSWGMVVDGIEVSLDACSVNNIDHCLVINSADTSKCMLCEYGYDIKSDQTACIKFEIDDCDEYAYHSLTHLTGTISTTPENTAKLTNLAAFLNYFGFNGRPQKVQGCNKCDAGKKPHFTTAASPSSFCIGTLNSGTIVDNCEIYKAEAGKCIKCVDGYISLADGSCVAKAADGKEDNCMSKTDNSASAGTNCTLCMGYRSHVSNSCYAYKNCDIIDDATKKCKRCDSGFKPDSTGYDCEAVDPDDICEIYETGGICVKCKDGTHSPVNLMDGATMIKISCGTKYNDSVSSAAADQTKHNGMFANNVYVIDINESAFASKFKTDTLYLASGSEGTYSEYFASDNAQVPRSVCIYVAPVPNCKTMNTDNTTRCDTCMDGYKLDESTNSCIDGDVDFCVNYATNGDCTKCDPEHFLASASECSLRNHTNCKVFVDNADECTECQPDQWKETLTSTNLHCHEYTIQNCKTNTETANLCSACDEGVRYLDGGECKLFTKQYCKTFSTTQDRCTDCNNDRWLDVADTHECMTYSVQNCLAYEDESDSCNGCKAGFYANGAQCLAPTAQNCATRDPSTDECDTCVVDTWMNGTLCEDNTAVNCRVKSQTANECTECLPAHWMDAANSNVCKVHTADNCATYTSDADTCATCAVNFYLTGTNACEDNTSMHCSVRSLTANECITCNEGYYLNAQNQCEVVTNTTCVTITPNTNNCDTCISTRYNDSTSGECMVLTVVDNCMTYSSTQDNCLVCKTGFYKSTDNLSCLPNPDGILGCISYTDLTNCSACRNTHYLMNNDCIELTQTPVANCAAYSGDGICSACDATFSLEGSTCEANVATGCLTWANKDACATCPPNAILNNGACTTTAISGCAVTSGSVGAETCITCDADKFLDNNTCTASGTTITQCILYTADGVCGACSTGFTVSANGSACDPLNTSIFGAHCSNASTNAPPVCSICGEGYLMDDQGACSVSCEASNCFICNPSDHSKCNICKTGYHMTSELVCEENGREESIMRLASSVLLLMAFLATRFDN